LTRKKEIFTSYENLSGSAKALDFDVKINRLYLNDADSFFLMLSFEKFDVRVTEMPWFCIDILN